MKRITTLFLTLFTFIVFSFAFTACKSPVTTDGDFVVIKAEKVEENTTLLQYMNALQEKGELSFTVENGMLTSIGDKKNTTKSYWMLYTSHSEFASEEWGVVDYQETTYASATLGVEDLIIKEGETYIWAYTTF